MNYFSRIKIYYLSLPNEKKNERIVKYLTFNDLENLWKPSKMKNDILKQLKIEIWNTDDEEEFVTASMDFNGFISLFLDRHDDNSSSSSNFKSKIINRI